MNQKYRLSRKGYTVIFSLILFFIVLSTRACQNLPLTNTYLDQKKEEEIRHWVERVMFCTVDVACSAVLMPHDCTSDEALTERVVSFFVKTTCSPDMPTLWDQNMRDITHAKKQLKEIGELELQNTDNLSSEVKSLIEEYRAYKLQSDFIFLMIELQLSIDLCPPFSEKQRPEINMVTKFFHDPENCALLNRCRRIVKGL